MANNVLSVSTGRCVVARKSHPLSDVVEISCWLVGGAGGEGLSSLPSGERQRASRLSSARGTAALCLHFTRGPVEPLLQFQQSVRYSLLQLVQWSLDSCALCFEITWFVDFLFTHYFGCGKSCSLISVVCFVLLRSVFRGLVESHIFCFNLFNIVSRIPLTTMYYILIK